MSLPIARGGERRPVAFADISVMRWSRFSGSMRPVYFLVYQLFTHFLFSFSVLPASFHPLPGRHRQCSPRCRQDVCMGTVQPAQTRREWSDATPTPAVPTRWRSQVCCPVSSQHNTPRHLFVLFLLRCILGKS